MAKRYFEFSEGTSNKFWEVWIDGDSVLTRYGKIGTDGSTTMKDQGSADAAQKLHDKLVREKTGKGYAEKTAGAAAVPAKPAPAKPTPAPAAPATPAAPVQRAATGASRYEFSEGGSSKFWEIQVEGATHTVRYGKIGTDGQARMKEFGSAALAQKDADKLIAEKTGKGYKPV